MRVPKLYTASQKIYEPRIECRLVSVHDGDTFSANIPGWPRIIGEEILVRIYGINAPELNAKDEREARLAARAKRELEKILRSANTIMLANIRRDKYFRLLATVYVSNRYGEQSVGELLLSQGLAKEYFVRRPKAKAPAFLKTNAIHRPLQS